MKEKIASIVIFLTMLVLIMSGCTDNEDDDRPVIKTFFSFPESINYGESSKLVWEVIGATSVQIDNGIGNVSSSGNKIVYPNKTTVYTLTATNQIGETTAEAEVFINHQSYAPPAITLRFSDGVDTAGPTGNFADNQEVFEFQHVGGDIVQLDELIIQFKNSTYTSWTKLTTDSEFMKCDRVSGDFSVGDELSIKANGVIGSGTYYWRVIHEPSVSIIYSESPVISE